MKHAPSVGTLKLSGISRSLLENTLGLGKRDQWSG
jgi:hypothetical protein